MQNTSGIFIRRSIQSIQHRRQTTFPRKWFKPLGQETGLWIYNCTAKRQVPFMLPNENNLTWYTCGPTVYDSAHLGHASCYVKLDIIQRILRYHFHFNLVTAMNITDIDDKIIVRSQQTGRDHRELAKYYEKEFWSDMKKLNVMEPNVKVRVTDNIPKIVEYIQKIAENGLAYVGPDNSVYFNVKNFPKYGKLLTLNLEDETDIKIENKSFSADFALWKAKKAENEPSWPSPWGEGRPGWHIECSTLAGMIFGSNIDIHAGGVDLLFPHHENEEAQSCAYHRTNQWVNYWIHTGHLNVKGETEKMSKSLKNTIPISEMLSKYTANEFRMACILSHYRNSMEYSDELMLTARQTLKKFKSFKSDCQAYLNGTKMGYDIDPSQIFENINYAKNQVNELIKNDFDTAGCMRVLIDQVTGISRCINGSSKMKLSNITCFDAVAAADNFVEHTLYTFGLSTLSNEGPYIENDEKIDVSALVDDILKSRKIIRERAVAIQSKDLFEICDELRNCLQQHGIEIKDHNKGSSWNFTNKK